ncbi:alanine--tRNA ligase [Candidatus Saccharibacteria bacterium]|nr:alanine--tRNA ligase [Candidatus Saccharibacteria bacterium]
MNASEVRQKFLEFQEKRGHKVIPPAPLVLENDPTTLFTGSGMQPLLPYLLGQPHPDGKRLTDSQPSLRLQDIEDVGDPRHTTVFEMLGNWSLGDYFKKEQIPAFFEFLTKEIGLDPHKIYVTCFIGNEKYGIPKDTEAAEIWQEVFKKAGVEAKIAEIGSAENGDQRGIKEGEHIFFYDDKENWWSRGGGIDSTPIGDPCGPDSEVFYDFGEDKQDIAKYGKSHPASDGARFMEIGNQVFMQYRRKEDGTFEELEHKNVDFGGGLERITAASIDSFDVFKISLLKPIIDKLEEMSGKSYDSNTDEMRIIADHLRGAYLLTAQGLTPSNKQQGYALRRLIRRAVLKALDLGIAKDFIPEVVPIIAKNYADLPDSILTHRETAISALEKEECAFRQTLNKGLKEMNKMVSLDTDGILTGFDLFKLQDTYGFPFEVSVEEAYRQNIQLSENYKAEFDKALAEQRERSKTASKGMFKGGLEDHGETSTKYHTATHLTLAALRKIVSADIHQQGSNITPERMRLDFNLDRKLTPEEKQAVEDQVNAWIKEDLPVSFDTFDKEYARDTLHAEGMFWDKYDQKVKVYTIGDFDNPVSREICGGPHVAHTSEIGKYKIKKEESSAAGIRRIKAIIE